MKLLFNGIFPSFLDVLNLWPHFYQLLYPMGRRCDPLFHLSARRYH